MHKLSREETIRLKELVQDALFWIDLESKKDGTQGFKFLAAHYGLENAVQEADQKGLTGKEREKFLRPHQDLFTMFNPYSGNGRETQTAPQE